MKKILIILVIITIQKTIAKPNYTTDPKWKEKNNEIIHKTVCYNYKKGSIKYRKCRNHSANIFKENCKKNQSKKFCYSSRNFRPVN